MLASDDIHLDWCFSTNSLWSTRYFKELSNVGRVKSSVDDLNGTWYCKHESSLCATICRGSASVPRFVRWHVSWNFTFQVCLLLPYLPPHCSPQQYTPQSNTTPLQPLRRHEEKHTPNRCVLNYLPETYIRVSFNNQPSRTTRRRTEDGGRGGGEEEEEVGCGITMP